MKHVDVKNNLNFFLNKMVNIRGKVFLKINLNIKILKFYIMGKKPVFLFSYFWESTSLVFIFILFFLSG